MNVGEEDLAILEIKQRRKPPGAADAPPVPI